MRGVKEKKERALGTKLFLKAERCNSPKCVMIRRPYRPGVHGSSRQRPITDYGRQLHEKQKIQIYFGLNNRQMRQLFRGAKDKAVAVLVRRLDYAAFLLGFAKSPRVARQLVSHGHILVNNRKVTVPSCRIKKGDTISIKPASRSLKIFEDIHLRLKQHTLPSWLTLSKEELKGESVGEPSPDDTRFPFDVNLVGQFYSR